VGVVPVPIEVGLILVIPPPEPFTNPFAALMAVFARVLKREERRAFKIPAMLFAAVISFGLASSAEFTENPVNDPGVVT